MQHHTHHHHHHYGDNLMQKLFKNKALLQKENSNVISKQIVERTPNQQIL